MTRLKLDSATVQLVLCIAEEGSISRAADRLSLAAAAASRRVSDLEQQLGAPLFTRVAHGVKITEAGSRLLAHIRQIDHLIDRLEEDAAVLSSGHDARVVIAAPKAAMIQFLAADLARLRQAYPQITLKVIEENSRIVQQLLRDRVIDIGIYEKTSGFLDLPQFDYRHDELVLVYSRAHYAFSGEAVGIDALLELPIVTLGKGSAVLTAIQRGFRSRGRAFSTQLITSGFDSMLALVRHGLGVGLMPPAVLHSLHPEAGLGTVALEGDWARRAYVLSAALGHAQQQALQNVLALLREPPR